MKKLCAIVCIIITFFIIYFLQVNFFNWFTIAGVKPNLFVVFVLVLGLFAGKKVGTISGLILGIYIDILTAKSIGISGIILMGLGFISGNLDKTFSKDRKLTIILTVIVGTLIFEVVEYVYSVFKFGTLFESIAFLKIVLIEIVFNILLIIILYPIIQNFGYKLESIFNPRTIVSRYF